MSMPLVRRKRCQVYFLLPKIDLAPFRPMALLFFGLFRKENRLPVTERLGHHQPLRLSLDERLLTANSGYLLR